MRIMCLNSCFILLTWLYDVNARDRDTCMPSKFFTSFIEKDGLTSKGLENNVVYDFDNQRVVSLIPRHGEEHQFVISDFSTSTRYDVYGDGSCRVFHDGHVNSQEVPQCPGLKNFTFLGENIFQV